MPITFKMLLITPTLMPITSTLMPITSTLMPIASTLMPITSPPWQAATPSCPEVFPSASCTLHLDGSSPANGFVRVVPGSHRGGCMGMPGGVEYAEGEVGVYCQRWSSTL